MKTFTDEELKDMLRKHYQWLNNEDGGIRADLSYSDLRGSDLSGSNLRGSNLSYSNLRGSNLSGSDLRDSNLSYSNLKDSNLRGSDLSGSDLSGSNLSGSNLRGSDLRGSDLSYSNLSYSNLRDSNLSIKYLKSLTQVVPEEGQYIAWKKINNNCICKLRIPTKSPRMTSVSSRKSRCKFATVLNIWDSEGKEIKEGSTDCRGPKTVYKVGRRVTADKWDNNILKECSHGIHHFITRSEAERW